MSHSYLRSFAVVLVALLAVPAFAGNLGAPAPDNHSWGGYHWARTANPLNLKVGDNLTLTEWKNDLATAVSDWNRSTVLNLTIVAGQASGKCRPTAGRDEVCNARYGNNGWLGLAQIWLSNGHISQGTEKMNDTYVMNNAEKLHVICQEIGHTFGLDHQSTDGSSQNTCMDYYQNTSNNDTTSTHPNQHDYAELATIYAHTDSFNSAFAGVMQQLSMPVVAIGDDLDEPWRWGTPVDFDNAGRADVFVLDRGNGEQVVTHVVWANSNDIDAPSAERQVK